MGRHGRFNDKILVYIVAFMMITVGMIGIMDTTNDALKFYGTKDSGIQHNKHSQVFVERALLNGMKENKTQDIVIDTIITIDDAYKYYYEAFAKYPEIFLNYSPQMGVLKYDKYSSDVAGYGVDYISKESGKIKAKEVNSVVKDIVADAEGHSADQDKVICVLNWLDKNCEYTDTPSNIWDASMYGCLVDGKTTCVGYAESFQYIMNELDIPCEILVDTKKRHHAWNRIVIDGKSQEIDPTN